MRCLRFAASARALGVFAPAASRREKTERRAAPGGAFSSLTAAAPPPTDSTAASAAACADMDSSPCAARAARRARAAARALSAGESAAPATPGGEVRYESSSSMSMSEKSSSKSFSASTCSAISPLGSDARRKVNANEIRSFVRASREEGGDARRRDVSVRGAKEKRVRRRARGCRREDAVSEDARVRV
eukprot:31457-Pelagococcus_subviridis.AAC.22